MHRMSLEGKLALSVIVSLSVSLVLGACIWAKIADEVLVDLKEDHLRFELNEIRNSVGKVTDIGLPLSALRRIQDVIDAARSRDPEIGAVLVYDTAGTIIYSTDVGEIGAAIPAPWRGVADWGAVRSADDGLVVMARLSNSFGNPMGGVALRLERSQLDRDREESWFFLIGLVLANGLAGALWVAWAVRRRLASCRRGVRDAMKDLAAVVAVRAPPDPPVLAADHWLADSYAPFAEGLRRSLAGLDGYADEVSRLDEMG